MIPGQLESNGGNRRMQIDMKIRVGFVFTGIITLGVLAFVTVLALDEVATNNDILNLNRSIYQLTNRSLLCDLLNGSCMEQETCDILHIRAIVQRRPRLQRPQFTCNFENVVCCFANTSADDVTVSEDLRTNQTEEENVERVISRVEDRGRLCAVLEGQCLQQEMCDMLHVKTLIENIQVPERPKFDCDDNLTCCFYNVSRNTIRQSPVNNPVTLSGDNRRTKLPKLTELVAFLKGHKSRLVNDHGHRRPLARFPSAYSSRYRSPALKHSYDYDDYGDYYRSSNHRDYHYNYDDYYGYRRPRRKQREPIGRLYGSGQSVSYTRRYGSARPRPKAGFSQSNGRSHSRSRYGYRPNKGYKKRKVKVTKKYQYHDDKGHGHSLLSHGLEGVFAKGFSDVFVSNLSAFCEIYDGVCVEPQSCATASGRSYHRFQCNTTTICCLPDYSIKRLHPLGHSSHKAHGGYNKGHGKGHSAKDLLLSHLSPGSSALFTQTDRVALCELKNGTCVHPSICNSHHDHDDHHHGGYGKRHDPYNSHKDFYCNLTSICCTPSLFDVETHVQVVHGYGDDDSYEH